MDIAVIDYGMGNLRSVSKAIEHVAPECDVHVTSDPDRVMQASRVVFPGQGAMPDCMREMDARGLRRATCAGGVGDRGAVEDDSRGSEARASASAEDPRATGPKIPTT